MLDSPTNPYQPPKAFLGVLGKDGGKLTIVFSILYYLVMDIVILLFLSIDIVIGFKVVPVFTAMYEGMGSKLPLITIVGLHYFTVKILPFIILTTAIALHFKKMRIQKYAKFGLLLLAIFSVALYYIILFGMRAPIDILKKSHSYYSPSDPRPNPSFNPDAAYTGSSQL